MKTPVDLPLVEIFFAVERKYRGGRRDEATLLLFPTAGPDEIPEPLRGIRIDLAEATPEGVLD